MGGVSEIILGGEHKIVAGGTISLLIGGEATFNSSFKKVFSPREWLFNETKEELANLKKEMAALSQETAALAKKATQIVINRHETNLVQQNVIIVSGDVHIHK